MAKQVRLRCAALGVTLRLPWWPEDVTETLSGWDVSTLTRPGRDPLDVPTSRTTGERTLGFTLRNEDYHESVAELVADLRRIVAAKAPVQLLMGERDTGLWRIDAGAQITEMAWADDDTPSVVDVDLVLKRASDAIVKVGPIKRIKGRATGVSRQR